jgi:hydroxymethylpyrimidine/phosphomethylpyrimidine kinase
MRKILSIAGFDPSAGAGVFIDSLVALEHGFFCYSAVTTVTAQNSMGVKDYKYTSIKLFQNELEALAEEGDIEGLKLGLLGKRKFAELAASFIRKNEFKFTVCDPILISSSGERLAEKGIISAYRKIIFPLSISTFNAIEAERFFGYCDNLEELFARVSEFSPSFVIKGGHYPGEVTDYVFHQGEVRSFTLSRIDKEVRGTGCAFSTSLLCYLLLGKDIFEAVKEAKYYVYEKIKGARKIGQGRYQMVFRG